MTKDERQKLDRILEELGEIKGYLERVKLHDKALYGNGQPGIQERLTKIEESRKTVLVMWSVINGLIGTVAGLLAAYFTMRGGM